MISARAIVRAFVYALLALHIAAAAIAAFAWLSNRGSAGELELAYGESRFCCRSPGVWWQEKFGWNGNLQPQSLELGYRERFGNFSLHAAYVDLGMATGRNVASMRDDNIDDFSFTDGCDPASRRNCLGNFAANQRVAGVLLGGAYGREVLGRLRLEAELGAYLYRTRWSIEIYCPGACGVNESAGPRFNPGARYSATSEIRRASYVALRASYRGFILQWRRFARIEGSGMSGDVDPMSDRHFLYHGLTTGPVEQTMIGYSLPF